MDGVAGGFDAVEEGFDGFLEVFVVGAWETLGMAFSDLGGMRGERAYFGGDHEAHHLAHDSTAFAA